MRLYKTSFSKYGTAYQLLLEREWKDLLTKVK